MSDVRLVELDGDDLAEYIVYLEKTYAEDMSRLGGVPIEEARERSRQSMVELFPDGRPAEGNQLWRAYDNDDQRIGLLWLARRAEGSARYAWIYDIEVEESQRGRGYGRVLMEHAERITREWGLDTLRLNVFGDNEVARRLYLSRGFREQNVIMSKQL